MRFEIEEPVWRHPSDKDIVFELPFFDVREDIIITDSNNDRVDNITLAYNRDYNRFGNNYVYNETVTDEFGSDFEKRLVFALSAKGAAENDGGYVNDYAIDGVDHIDLVAVRPEAVGIVEPFNPGEEKFWSEPDTWQSGEVPIEGEVVKIEGDMNVVFDLE
jgi:hypothetical protein